MTNCNSYKNIQFYGEKKVVDLVGLEPMTVCDQAKFDLFDLNHSDTQTIITRCFNPENRSIRT